MNKFKALLRSWDGQLPGTYSLTDTFKNLPASVSGANGAQHRYVSALLITAHAHLISDATPTPAALDLWAALDFLIGRITWTRYGGSFVPQPLSARELVGFLSVQGCITIGKQNLVVWATPWVGSECDVYASIIIPTTPTMFSTGHTKNATDAPFPACLLGASSAYTIQGWVSLADISGNETYTCPAGIHIDASATCLDSKRVIVARPIEYKKFVTSDDPAVLPSQFCKMPTVFCAAADKKNPIAAYLSDVVVPIVRVDGRQLSERMPGRVFEIADLWYRDDADRAYDPNLGGLLFILRNTVESSKMILQPAGSQWSVEGIGNAQGSKVAYYYTPVYDPSGPLVAYQLGQMGVDPSANTIGNVKINSNSRSGMTLTEEEQVGIPQILGDTAFNEG